MAAHREAADAHNPTQGLSSWHKKYLLVVFYHLYYILISAFRFCFGIYFSPYVKYNLP